MAGEPKNTRPFTAPAPTPGKTPVPARSVTGFKTYKTQVKLAPGQSLGFQSGRGYYARPAAKSTNPVVRPPKPKVAVLTPQQQAQQAVDQELAPLYAQENTQYGQQQDALRQFTAALMQQVAGIGPQDAAAYNQAASGQTSLVEAAAHALQQANPNGSDQTLLQSIGAPASQQADVANQLSNTFNGGAAVQLYANGALPIGAMRQQGLAATTIANSLPAIEGLRGQQNLLSLVQGHQKALSDLAAQQPGLIQKWQDSYNTAQYHQAVLHQNQQKQAWQQTYQKNLLSLKQQGLINDRQYRQASLALRQSSQNSTNAYRQAQLALKENGFKTVGNDKTGIYAVRPDGSKQLLIPPVTAAKTISSSVRQKIVTEISGHKQGYWGSATDGSPVTRAQLVGAAKSANMTLQQFLNDPKAQQEQGIGYVPALKDRSASDPEINQVYLDAIRKYGLTRQQAFDLVGKYFPGWKGRNQKSFFPKGEAPQGGASGASYNAPLSPSLRGSGAQYITYRASQLGLDPRAVLGVSTNEGLSGGVGDNGTSFGPFQMHAGGALPSSVWARGAGFAQQWAWSPAGIDYALQEIAKVARGKRGRAAVDAIVRQFERPANPSGDLQAGYSYI